MSAAPLSEAFQLAEMVTYQEGSVVSRQITKSDSGNVTLFAFDKGQELSEHTSPYDALVHVLEGQAEIRLGGKVFLLSAGEIIVMPADVPHGLKAPARFKMLLTMIRN
jgi:quercetin dioxygenase-like cupin family protein